MNFRQFILKKEILIKNYTKRNIWNVMEYNEDKGEIIIFLFNSKEKRDAFIKEGKQ